MCPEVTPLPAHPLLPVRAACRPSVLPRWPPSPAVAASSPPCSSVCSFPRGLKWLQGGSGRRSGPCPPAILWCCPAAICPLPSTKCAAPCSHPLLSHLHLTDPSSASFPNAPTYPAQRHQASLELLFLCALLSALKQLPVPAWLLSCPKLLTEPWKGYCLAYSRQLTALARENRRAASAEEGTSMSRADTRT